MRRSLWPVRCLGRVCGNRARSGRRRLGVARSVPRFSARQGPVGGAANGGGGRARGSPAVRVESGSWKPQGPPVRRASCTAPARCVAHDVSAASRGDRGLWRVKVPRRRGAGGTPTPGGRRQRGRAPLARETHGIHEGPRRRSRSARSKPRSPRRAVSAARDLNRFKRSGIPADGVPEVSSMTACAHARAPRRGPSGVARRTRGASRVRLSIGARRTGDWKRRRADGRRGLPGFRCPVGRCFRSGVVVTGKAQVERQPQTACRVVRAKPRSFQSPPPQPRPAALPIVPSPPPPPHRRAPLPSSASTRRGSENHQGYSPAHADARRTGASEAGEPGCPRAILTGSFATGRSAR